MEPFNWTCPFCDRDTTITGSNYQDDAANFGVDSADGKLRTLLVRIVCPNKSCRKSTLQLFTYELNGTYGNYSVGALQKSWTLIPPSQAKVFPDYVPKQIQGDYLEACLIRDLSPKASATLARRCLQGMIRNFWDIKKARLVDEVNELKDKVDGLVWQAIDGLRRVGNIGAHMEVDINVIVDVDEGEAGKLIGLIELLMKEWYIARHEREQRVKEVIALAQTKQQAKATKP
ncbi:MAG TPA: DUF4145 domain-containing protein [Terriglobales bacterium]|nr:DUF4145 domain-containing protein [Terriglobales bacterium]